jgi:serine protease
MRKFTRWSAVVASILAACGGGGGGGGGSVELDGTVAFVPETPAPIAPLVLEGPSRGIDLDRPRVDVDATRMRRVRGEITDGVASVRLHSRVRQQIVARLAPGSAGRLAHLDPLSLDVSTPAREVRFLARGPFELIVRGPDGPFELEVRASALGAVADVDGHLGALAAGDQLELLARDGRSVRWSCAEALELEIEAHGACEVRNAQGQRIASTDAGGGVLRASATTLDSFEVVTSGEDAAPLSIRAVASAAQRPLARVRTRQREREAFELAANERLATDVSAPFVPGEVLVRARFGSDLTDDAERRSARLAQRIPETSDLFALELPAGLDAVEAARTTLAAIAAFEVSDKVEWAEPNRIRYALGGVTEPNDQFYNLQKWHYDLIRMPDAWNITQGSANVVVAVIDTGIRSHPDLNGNDGGEGFDFISSASNAGDADGIDSDPTDPGDGTGITPSSFHGTHVAGTVGALGNNNTGVSGVNWDVSLMHLRVLGLQGGTDADIAQAVRYAAGLSSTAPNPPTQRADIINLSLGGPGSTSTMQNAVTAARNAGVVIFAAAGNNNSSQNFFPASYTGVVSVSAVDRNAEKAPYSNFGPFVDIAAPGGNTSVDLDGDGFVDGVLSTLVNENNGFSPNFVFYQGTSMACPHVAGVAALMIAAAAPTTLTPAQIESILQTTAVDLGAPGRDNVFGNGLMRADLAVAAAQNGVSVNPVLSISPASLDFGADTTLLSIGVSNTGSGALDVGTPTFAPLGGAPVFATLQTVASSGATDVSSVRVTVDRAPGGTPLADGTYTGLVTIPSNGGTAFVNVTMQVETPVAPVDVELFVLLVRVVDPVTFELETEDILTINPTTGLDFAFPSGDFGSIGGGEYILVCGSDDDGDLTIGGVNDIYFGAWPTLNDILVLDLDRGDELTGLDFVVQPDDGSSTTAAGASLSRRPIPLPRAKK